jgi:predicted N-formylglutamate amidohydrolase
MPGGAGTAFIEAGESVAEVMERLLQPDEPAAVGVRNPAAASRVLFVSDHAGKRIPRRLGTLGLGAADLDRHIAWDIGIQGVTERLADALDATYIYQRYSRLVIDCNRLPGSTQSIMAVSDGTEVPGNRNLEVGAIRSREREILAPYHAAIERELDRRQAAQQACVIFAMHSCTPVFGTEAPRPWHIGVIANADWRIGDALIDLLTAETDLCVGRNKPYSMNLDMDYTLPVHAERRRLAYVEIEIRQDLIAEAAGQAEWASLMSRFVPRALERSEVLAS